MYRVLYLINDNAPIIERWFVTQQVAMKFARMLRRSYQAIVMYDSNGKRVRV